MHRSAILLFLVVLLAHSLFADVTVVATKGTVSVRRGVQEQWLPLLRGDVLKPEDSIQSGTGAGITVRLEDGRSFVIPENSILHISDLRTLTQEELLLLLSMEHIRMLPDTERGNELSLPRTTTVHGDNRNAASGTARNSSAIGLKEVQGASTLYGNGFFASYILRIKSIVRLNPELHVQPDVRLKTASAMEQMNVFGEALAEYQNIASSESLSPVDRATVARKIEQLRARGY